MDIERGKELAKPEQYDETRFWKVVGRQAAKWGSAILLQVLTLYYCMLDPATPAKSKAIIAGALAYTVLPTDLIPDLLPVIGWGDDVAMIAWAGYEVVSSINDQHRQKARSRVERLLGSSASSGSGGGATGD